MNRLCQRCPAGSHGCAGCTLGSGPRHCLLCSEAGSPQEGQLSLWALPPVASAHLSGEKVKLGITLHAPWTLGEKGTTIRTHSEDTQPCKRNTDRLPPVLAPTGDAAHDLLVYRTTLQPTEPLGQGLFAFKLLSEGGHGPGPPWPSRTIYSAPADLGHRPAARRTAAAPGCHCPWLVGSGSLGVRAQVSAQASLP